MFCLNMSQEWIESLLKTKFTPEIDILDNLADGM